MLLMYVLVLFILPTLRKNQSQSYKNKLGLFAPNKNIYGKTNNCPIHTAKLKNIKTDPELRGHAIFKP